MKKYTPPIIEVIEVHAEESFATGSVGTVNPVESGKFVQDEFQGEEQTFDVTW